MAVGPSTNPPSLASDAGDSSNSSVIDEGDYPFGVPSFSPPITDVKEVQETLRDKDYFGDTKCDIFEASAKGCQWRHDINDEGLNETLRDSQKSEDTKVHFRAFFFNFPRDTGPSGVRPVSLNQQTAKELLKKCGLSPQAFLALLDIRGIVASRTTYDKSNELSTFESCYRLLDFSAEGTNILLSYDFFKTCTTCIVSASLNAIKIDDIAERLSFCFQGRNPSDHEGPKRTDPFCLYRVIMARFMEKLSFRSKQVTNHLIDYTNDTLEYLESPNQLKDRTLDIYRQGNGLRNLVLSIDSIDSSLKKISVDSSWLFEKLGAACTVSQAVSAKEDLDYLRADIKQLRIRIAFADSIRFDMLTLANNLVSQSHSLSSTVIASETRKDSASMKTIAALTMLFLPATFIATVFGMSFFEYSERGISVSGQWWVYGAIAVPTTLLIFIVWWAWNPGTEPFVVFRLWLRRRRLVTSVKRILRTIYRMLGPLFHRRSKSNASESPEVYTIHSMDEEV